MKISTKLTILCLFLVLASTSILYFFTSRKFETSLRNEILASLKSQASFTISSVERFIYDRLNDIRVSSTSPIFQQEPLSQEDLIARLKELESLNELYYSFSFFTPDRVRLADSKGESIGRQQSNSLYWTDLSKDDPLVIDISKSEAGDRNVMQLAALVPSETDTTTRGVLVGRILVDELYNLMGDISLGNDDRQPEVYLLANDGMILYSNLFPEAALSQTYGDFDIIRNVGSEGVEFKETDDNLYFAARQKAFNDYQGNDWMLVLSMAKEDAFVSLDELQSTILWILIPVLIGSILLAMVAANYFVTPIVKLSKAADEIGKGNLNVSIDADSSDEVGTLGKQLGKTTQILIKRIEEQRKLNQQLEDQKNEIQEQKQLIENVNLQLTDSISYAKRIQHSMLPDPGGLERVVKDIMVFYQPKDIVSGDFYWIERVRKGRSEHLVIACADCTGHGVPGAIMSIMGANLLTNIVYYQNYLDPQRIIARLDKAIKMELYREDGGDETKKEGMEIGVCVVNLDEYEMEFSGVGIPLYMIRDGELTVTKSIREMAGGMEGDERDVEARVTKTVIEVKKGDRFYMTTDGFQDQFGGPNDKKYLTKNLRQLLLDYKDTPLKEQSAMFEKVFRDWKGDGPQTDDVQIIGFEP